MSTLADTRDGARTKGLQPTLMLQLVVITALFTQTISPVRDKEKKASLHRRKRKNAFCFQVSKMEGHKATSRTFYCLLNNRLMPLLFAHFQETRFAGLSSYSRSKPMRIQSKKYGEKGQEFRNSYYRMSGTTSDSDIFVAPT